MNWQNIRVRLGDLKPWASNPRLSTKEQAKRLLASFEKFGQVQTVAVGPDLQVYDGHQRLSALLTLHGPDYELDARQSSRELTEAERQELVVTLHTGATGSWNWDALASWDASALQTWGLDRSALKEWNNDALNLREMLGAENGSEADEYSRKIQAPIYTPKGEKPQASELFDTRRTQELLKEIDGADIPEEEKEFLRIAAQRHTVLNFKRIAEYYAHSSEAVQTLMENSALVIIDFNRAIELGYVKLSEEIAKQYQEDYPDA